MFLIMGSGNFGPAVAGPTPTPLLRMQKRIPIPVSVWLLWCVPIVCTLPGVQVTQGVGQSHVHHEALLIIIILNVVLLSFDDDILYKDDFIQSFYSHFHHQHQKSGHLMPLSLKLYFSTMALFFLTKVTSF